MYVSPAAGKVVELCYTALRNTLSALIIVHKQIANVFDDHDHHNAIMCQSLNIKTSVRV